LALSTTPFPIPKTSDIKSKTLDELLSPFIEKANDQVSTKPFPILETSDMKSKSIDELLNPFIEKANGAACFADAICSHSRRPPADDVGMAVFEGTPAGMLETFADMDDGGSRTTCTPTDESRRPSVDDVSMAGFEGTPAGMLEKFADMDDGGSRSTVTTCTPTDESSDRASDCKSVSSDGIFMELLNNDSFPVAPPGLFTVRPRGAAIAPPGLFDAGSFRAMAILPGSNCSGSGPLVMDGACLNSPSSALQPGAKEFCPGSPSHDVGDDQLPLDGGSASGEQLAMKSDMADEISSDSLSAARPILIMARR